MRLVLLVGSGGRETALAHALTKTNLRHGQHLDKITKESSWDKKSLGMFRPTDQPKNRKRLNEQIKQTVVFFT